MKRKVIHEFMKNATDKVRVALDEYGGREVIDIRVYFRPSQEDKWLPTKKGITLLAERIPDLKESIEKAEKEYQK